MARKRKEPSSSDESDDSSNSESEQQQKTTSSSSTSETTKEPITADLINKYMEGKIEINKAESPWGQPLVDIKNRKEKNEKASFGYCRVCEAEVKGGLHAMKNHLLTCEKLSSEWTEEASETKDVSIGWMIYPAADDWNRYWLFVEQSFASKLEFLDDTIRDIWVECCYHSSVMEAPDRFSYTNSEGMLDALEEGGELFSKTQLFKVVSPSCVGKKFGYKYDFGTPTDLVVELIYVKRCKEMQNVGRILARNHSLTHKCKGCKKKASKISQEDYQFYCDECMEEDDSSLSICNSPRMGCCGFEGDLDDFIPDSIKKKAKSPAKKKKK